MSAKSRKQLEIHVRDDFNHKSAHEHISGILRYAARKPNWRVRIFPATVQSIGARNGPDPTPDGVISCPGTELTLPCRRLRYPVVILDCKYPSRCDATVSVDDRAIASAAAELFRKRQLAHTAYVGSLGISYKFHSDLRAGALQENAHAGGRTCSFFSLKEGESWSDELHRMSEWLASIPHPCGVMAFNDERARKVLDACRLAHLNVPEQIRLVGVDNQAMICENLQPTLTSIQPDFEYGGYLSAAMLDELLEHGRRRSPIRKTYGVKTVMERMSTQDPTGSGRLVSMACEFIRLHAGEDITVSDIARHLNVCRRTLEHRFSEVLNHTVACELRQRRLDRVCELLRHSDRKIADITMDSGFSSPNHLKAAFKKAFGLTMSDYRNVRQLTTTRPDEDNEVTVGASFEQSVHHTRDLTGK